MSFLNPKLFEALRARGIQMRRDAFPLGTGAVSHVYHCVYNANSCAIKISGQAESDQDRKVLQRRFSILSQVPTENCMLPFIDCFQIEGRLITLWEEADSTLEDVIRRTSADPVRALSRSGTMEMLSMLTRDVTVLLDNHVRGGKLHPSGILVFPEGLRLGDFSRSCLIESRLEKVGIRVPELSPAETDWRCRHEQASYLYSLAIFYIKLRCGRFPLALTTNEIDLDSLDGFDGDERRLLMRTLGAGPHSDPLLLRPEDWLKEVAGGSSWGTIGDEPKGVRACDVHWHWFDSHGHLEVLFGVVPGEAMLLTLYLPHGERITVEVEALATQTRVIIPKNASAFEVSLTARNGMLIDTQSFVSGPCIEIGVIESGLRWAKGDWEEVEFQFRNPLASVTALEAILEGEVVGVDLVRSSALELQTTLFYLSPSDSKGNRGPATRVQLPPVVRRVMISFNHRWDRSGEFPRQFLLVRLDAQSCIVPPEAEIVWERSLVDETSPERSKTFSVLWKSGQPTEVEIRKVVTKDSVSVCFGKGNLVHSAMVMWGTQKEELDSLTYTYQPKL